MQWTEDLSIGVAEIDAQHRELFDKINALVDAIKHAECKFVIDGVIRFLEEYASVHFSHEEQYMIAAGYPGYAGHKAQHEVFMNSLARLKVQASEPRVKGSSYELSVATNQMVVDWIIAHILSLDKKFGEFLRSR